MNPDSTQPTPAHGHTMAPSADGDAPHKCEFCSPEPEPITASRNTPTGEDDEHRSPQVHRTAVPDIETISELWL